MGSAMAGIVGLFSYIQFVCFDCCRHTAEIPQHQQSPAMNLLNRLPIPHKLTCGR
jgi:hypothetical protein